MYQDVNAKASSSQQFREHKADDDDGKVCTQARRAKRGALAIKTRNKAGHCSPRALRLL